MFSKGSGVTKCFIQEREHVCVLLISLSSCAKDGLDQRNGGDGRVLYEYHVGKIFLDQIKDRGRIGGEEKTTI